MTRSRKPVREVCPLLFGESDRIRRGEEDGGEKDAVLGNQIGCRVTMLRERDRVHLDN